MKKIMMCAFLSSIIVAIISYYFSTDIDLYEFYAQNLRNSLFTSFLTLGSFLFSLKTFIIIKMKENVYDSPKYNEKVKKSKKYDISTTKYGPLKRLSNLLFYSVLFSIITSVSQFTIGFIHHKISAILCLSISAFTITIFLESLLIIKENLNNWFDCIEEAAKVE